MLGLGFPEIAVILLLVLVLFGPKKLPDLARTIGKGLAEFKGALNHAERSIKTTLADEEIQHASTPVTPKGSGEPSPPFKQT